MPMSIRSIRSHFALSLRAALLATAASSLAACGTQVDSEASAVVSSCQQQSDVLLRQDFSQGAPGWSLVTSQPADPGHDWTIEHGKLRSDPAGLTLPGGYYNRFDSPSFEPMG